LRYLCYPSGIKCEWYVCMYVIVQRDVLLIGLVKRRWSPANVVSRQVLLNVSFLVMRMDPIFLVHSTYSS
jgi:hypothetical protein